jgi:glycosyltransferase involved in cell wall biosynthesis
MRIGVDATCWANERGYGRFTRELVGAMVSQAPAHEFVCFLDKRSADCFQLRASNVVPRIVPQTVAPTLAAASGSRRSIGDMLRLSNAVRRERVDVFLSPSVYGYFPLPPGLPAVVTVHDAIAERFPAMTLPTRWDRWSWRAKVWLALAQARLVLTVSDYAAAQIAAHLAVPPSRMRVTYEGVSDAYRPSDSAADVRAAARRIGLPDEARWLMYVGGFGPHKHVDLLVRAHAAVARRRTESPLLLVLAGPNQDGFHEDTAGIRDAIRECGTGDLVRWAGYLPDEELRHLHSGAVALMLVSASEGFGLPAVEAARCGAPVIATTESPLPQILAGAGVFITPGDPEAIAAAIERLLTNEPERRAMGARAIERAQALSWSRSAGIALEALQDAGAVTEKVGSKAHVRT